MIDAGGQVVATVFAAITGAASRRPGGFAVPNGLVDTQLSGALARNRFVGTGPCGS